MVNLKLRVYPDPFLLKPSQKIPEVKDSHIKIAFRMMQAMKVWKGIGLSAPQVGVPFAIVVIDTMDYEGGKKRIMYNPEIISASQQTIEYDEGCLSFPNQSVKTNRPYKCEVKYTNGGNLEVIEEFEGITAICVQHEIDHINGKLFKY